MKYHNSVLFYFAETFDSSAYVKALTMDYEVFLPLACEQELCSPMQTNADHDQTPHNVHSDHLD